MAGTFVALAQSNGIYRELWQNLPSDSLGNTLDVLTNTANNPNWPNRPDAGFTRVFPTFETDINTGMNNYGQRVRSYIRAPQTGAYTFWIASDDSSNLFLSTDETPGQAKVIAFVPDWTSERQWDKEPSQKSASVNLQAGKRYYIEAIMQQGGGGDNLAVGWKLPDGTLERPIPGNRLELDSQPIIVAQPTDATVVENSPATFTVVLSNFVPPFAQWQTGGKDIPGANSLTLTLPTVPMTANGSTYRCVITNLYGSTTSTVARLIVTPDTTAPLLVDAYNLTLTSVTVFFSKPVNPTTATNRANYAISPTTTVSSIVMAGPSAVTLNVAPLSLGTKYTVTVNRVQDLSAKPNAIAPDSRFSFVASSFIPAGIGMTSIPGSAVSAGNGYDVTGAGRGVIVNGLSDQFQFNYLPQSGNFDISVRVQGLDNSNPFAQAGLMVRRSTSTNDAFAAVLATPSLAGCFFAQRSAAGGPTVTAGAIPVNYPDMWVRLQRVGTQVNGFAGVDGFTWTPLGSATLPSGPVLVGLVVSSATSQSTEAQFRDYGPPPGTATGTVTRTGEPIGPSSRRTPMVFSEIMYKPAPRVDGRNLEFVEIYNSNPWWEDIGGYQIAGSIQYRFPEGTILPGGGYLVVAAVPEDLRTFYGIKNVNGPYTGSLKKTGRLELINDVGGTVLTLSYANTLPWPVAADGTGHSLVLARPTYGEADPRAWALSDRTGGSPGGTDAFHPDPLRNLVINKFLANPGTGQSAHVEIYNHSTTALNLSGCSLSDDPNIDRFRFPTNTTLTAGGHTSLTATSLGFAPNPAGGFLFLKNSAGTRVLDAVSYEAQATGVAYGRWPDGAPDFYPLSTNNPGQANANMLLGDVVINEIMYDTVSGDTDDQFVELYNKGTRTVDLTGWQFTSGMAFTFPDGATLAPGAYLVIAASKTNLLAHYPHLNALNTLGDFSGKLPSGGRLALSRPDAYVTTNTVGGRISVTILVVADEVTYDTGGRWGRWAHGGGSSLELIDPNTNHRLAYNWADSDETRKSAWTNLTVTGYLDNGANYAGKFDGLQVGLLDVGEALVDNLSVQLGATAPNLVPNGDFELGMTNWTQQGDHIRSSLEPSTGLGGLQSANSLHLRSTDGMWTGGNGIVGLLNANTLRQGSLVTLKLSGRWLRGWPEVLLRLRGNWLELSGMLPVPQNLGTPGLPNSRRVGAPPPAIYAVSHSPAIPTGGQSVAVTARFHHFKGVSPKLLYRIDVGVQPTPTYSTIPMRDDGAGGDAVANDGLYTAVIPAQGSGTAVAFLVQAVAPGGATSIFPADIGDNSGIPRECVVVFGDPTPKSTFGQYHLWLTQNWLNRWATLGGLSNEDNDGTFVDGGGRIIYNMGGHYAGSPYHQYNGNPVYTLGGQHWSMPEDNVMLGSASFNKQHLPGNGPLDDQTLQREQTSFWMSRQLKLPWPNRRYYSLFVNGVQHGPLMEDCQIPNSDFLKEYYPSDHKGYLYKNNAWFEFEPQVQPGGYINFNNNSWCTLLRFNTSVPGGGVAPKLARYRWNYWCRQSPTTISDYSAVYSLIDTANATGSGYRAGMEALVDTEEYLQVSALEHATGDWDSYVTQNQWNMYSYKPLNGKWRLLKWDWNISLGNSGSWGPDGGNLLNLTSVDATMSRFETDTPYFRAYLRSLKAIADHAMNNTYVDPVLDAKYAAFAANGLTSAPWNVAEPGANGLKKWIGTMNKSIVSVLQSRGVLSIPFAVTSGTNLMGGDTNVFINGTAPLEVKTIRVNGLSVPLTWTGTKNWSIKTVALLSTNILVLQGIDAYGGTVPSATGVVTMVNTNAPTSQGVLPVRINEWMAGNKTTIIDPANGKSEDWFELFNPNRAPFDLSGHFLSDSFTNTTQFKIPPGSVMAPLSVLMVWADKGLTSANDGGTFRLHANFRLSKAGEAIALFDPNGNLIDGVKYGPQTDDISEGRYPDGGPLIYSMSQPTPGTPNRFANTAPKLDPLTDRSVKAGTLLTFQAIASDINSPPQSLGFGLDTNAPAGAEIDSKSGIFFWTPTQAGVFTLGIHVADDGTPSLSDTTTFKVTVTAAPPPFITVLAPTLTASTFTLNWEAQPGQTYRVQYKLNLTDAQWTDVPGDIPAVGPTASKSDTVEDGSPHRFYRIITIP
jgi:regulation of enolase protein 1 (concanavalin A-like superfamily)